MPCKPRRIEATGDAVTASLLAHAGGADAVTASPVASIRRGLQGIRKRLIEVATTEKVRMTAYLSQVTHHHPNHYTTQPPNCCTNPPISGRICHPALARGRYDHVFRGGDPDSRHHSIRYLSHRQFVAHNCLSGLRLRPGRPALSRNLPRVRNWVRSIDSRSVRRGVRPQGEPR